jgi:hypothetical protein
MTHTVKCSLCRLPFPEKLMCEIVRKNDNRTLCPICRGTRHLDNIYAQKKIQEARRINQLRRK